MCGHGCNRLKDEEAGKRLGDTVQHRWRTKNKSQRCVMKLMFVVSEG